MSGLVGLVWDGLRRGWDFRNVAIHASRLVELISDCLRISRGRDVRGVAVNTSWLVGPSAADIL